MGPRSYPAVRRHVVLRFSNSVRGSSLFLLNPPFSLVYDAVTFKISFASLHDASSNDCAEMSANHFAADAERCK